MVKQARIGLQKNIFLYLTYAIVFTIPVYGRLLPLLIGLMALNWLIEGRYLKTFRLIFTDRYRLLSFSFSLLYFFYLAGLILTDNFHYAAEDLETKLSILIFPLIFATSGFPLFSRVESRTIIRVFTAGCLAGTILLLGRAFYHGVMLHQPGTFYYTGLSWNYHPGYYAMYITFAVSNILFSILIKQNVTGIFRLSGHILILLLFTLMIILLSSKAGMIIWLAVVGFYTIMLFFRCRRWLAGLIFIASAMGTFITLLVIFPNAAGRVSQAKQDMARHVTAENQGQSTGERLAILKASEEIIRKNFFFGVGTGDVKDALLAQYEADSLDQVLTLKLNAHNQFIQTFIALGVLGMILLLAMFVVPAYLAFRQGSCIYFAFLFITGISMVFESMLETQAGVIFYAFFNTLLFSFYLADKSGDPVDIMVSKAGT